MMPDTNQGLPQHNAKHLLVRTYREIGNAPEDVCLFDLQGSIISHVHWTHTLWPRRHGQPPTIGLPEHNEYMNDQPVPNLQDIRGWMNQQHTLWQRSISRHQTIDKLYKNMISKSITYSFRHNAMPSADQGYWNTMTSTILPTTC